MREQNVVLAALGRSAGVPARPEPPVARDFETRNSLPKPIGVGVFLGNGAKNVGWRQGIRLLGAEIESPEERERRG